MSIYYRRPKVTQRGRSMSDERAHPSWPVLVAVSKESVGEISGADCVGV